MVTGPPFRGCLVFRFRAIHAGFKISATFVITVLQVVFVATLPELNFGDLRAVLSEHHVLLRVSGRCLLGFIKTSKELATVFDLTVRGSFELNRHTRNRAPSKAKLQVIILDWTLYPESCMLHQWSRRVFKLQDTGFLFASRI